MLFYKGNKIITKISLYIQKLIRPSQVFFIFLLCKLFYVGKQFYLNSKIRKKDSYL